MKQLFPYILFALIIGITYSCEKETTSQVEVKELPPIVIDGRVSDKPEDSRIILSQPINTLNEIPKAITNATVLVFSGDSTWFFEHDTSHPGTYRPQAYFKGVVNSSYTMQVIHNNMVFSAKATMPPPIAFTTPKFSVQPDNLLELSWVAETYNPLTPACYELLLDWSHLPDYQSLPKTMTTATLRYYTLTTIDVNQILPPLNEDISFPTGTTIIENCYSVSQDYEAFLHALLLETNWQGGLFGSQGTQIPSNISNNAAGYFHASAVTSLSLVAAP